MSPHRPPPLHTFSIASTPHFSLHCFAAALLHDLLDMESNRVTCQVEGELNEKKKGGGGAAGGKKVVRTEKYDLNDPTDTFWRAHAGDGFSKVGGVYYSVFFSLCCIVPFPLAHSTPNRGCGATDQRVRNSECRHQQTHWSQSGRHLQTTRKVLPVRNVLEACFTPLPLLTRFCPHLPLLCAVRRTR
jgi:hypothetical protein